MMVVYGIIIVAFISYPIGITLSELSSIMPSAGGQYVWTRVLAPRKYSGILSYLCGSLAWAGSLFSSASLALSISLCIMSFWELTHPNHVTQSWQLFVIFQMVNALLSFFNCYGKYLHLLGSGALYMSIIAYVVITVTVLVCARGSYQDAEFVFVTLRNHTGWKTPGIAFVVGLINSNWTFAGLDCAAHMAEEVYRPERVIPIAIMGTVTIGLVTSFTFAIAMFFSIRNLDDIIQKGSLFPIIDIFYQALKSEAGAICLGTLVIFSLVGATISCHTWQARLCWSFSRDNGLPFSDRLARIHPKLDVPLNAHLLSTVLVAILGCLYLASSTAFNSMVVGCVTFMMLSYLVPTACLMYRGRNNIKHGYFWLGSWGALSNTITIMWAVFALVVYSLPFYMPVTGGSMNYASVVYAVYAIFALGYWYFPIKKYSCRVKFAGGIEGNQEDTFPDVCLTNL